MMVRIGSNSPMLDRKPMAETKIQENPAFLLSDWALGLARQLGALRTHILCALARGCALASATRRRWACAAHLTALPAAGAGETQHTRHVALALSRAAVATRVAEQQDGLQPLSCNGANDSLRRYDEPNAAGAQAKARCTLSGGCNGERGSSTQRYGRRGFGSAFTL